MDTNQEHTSKSRLALEIERVLSRSEESLVIAAEVNAAVAKGELTVPELQALLAMASAVAHLDAVAKKLEAARAQGVFQ